MEGIEGLLIGSGGSRGYLYLGALHRLYAENYLDNVKHFAGVSVGAVLCFLLACGINPREIWMEVKNVNSADLVTNSSNFISKLGIFKMDKIKAKIEKFVYPIFRKSPTFQDLFDKTGNELYVLANNISKNRKAVFKRETHPDMEISAALCMSCSIPLLFEPYYYEGNEYTDGAMHDSYPLFMIDDGVRNILGLYIDDHIEDNEKIPIVKINAILTGNMDSRREDTIEKSGSNCKHIPIHSKFLDSTGISLDLDKKITLMASGDVSTQLWIQDYKGKGNKTEEKAKFTYLKVVGEYGEMLLEESDQEYEIEEVAEVSKEAFQHHVKYDEEFLQ